MDMCRFTGLDDVEYKKVAAAIHRTLDLAITEVPGHSQGPSETVSKQRALPKEEDDQKRLMECLQFKEMYDRHGNIDDPHPQTCEWFLRTQEYTDWCNPQKFPEHAGILWIRAKPGAGKSTIMKFLYALLVANKSPDMHVISFFFHARGVALERSVTGMYRSLLFQLLETLPGLKDVVLRELKRTSASLRWREPDFEWNTKTLQRIFRAAITNLGPSHLTCFIDALDEADEDEVRDMVDFLEELSTISASKAFRLRSLFASRHYPHITVRNGKSFILDGHNEHNSDISRYIQDKLDVLGNGQTANSIRMALERKAAGVFIWVVIVVRILKKEFDAGNIHALLEKLEGIPDGSNMSEFFKDMITRDNKGMDNFLLCVQLLLYARKELTCRDLYFAILYAKPGGASFDPETEPSAMARFITSCSKGLAEVLNPCDWQSRVQFIHETVRDYLSQSNGLRELLPTTPEDFIGYTHLQLRNCCQNTLQLAIANGILHIKPSLSSFSIAYQFPFLRYSIHCVLEHAEVAGAHGYFQDDYLKTFVVEEWLALYHLSCKIDHSYTGFRSRFDVRDTTLHVLIGYECPYLTGAQLRIRDYRLYQQSRFCAGQLDCPTKDFDINAKDIRGHTPLSKAVIMFMQTAVASLLAFEGISVNSQDNMGRTALMLACNDIYHGTRSAVGMVNLLLATGQVNVNAKDCNRRTALIFASSSNNKPVVGLLLKTNGIDINAHDMWDNTALSIAKEKGNWEIARILLDAGADERVSYIYPRLSGHISGSAQKRANSPTRADRIISDTSRSRRSTSRASLGAIRVVARETPNPGAKRIKITDSELAIREFKR
jgi:hypothetical protein